jgi:4-amino-4-deoxy-L-arabinose transferase-like glycosyltransferase
MSILLIPATFISVFLGLTGYHSDQRTPLADWRTAFLQSAAFLGGYMVLFSELLSIFHVLNSFWVAFFWGAALIFSAVLGWRKGWIASGVLSLKTGWKKPGWFDLLAGGMIAIIMALLFLIAIKSPINNNDSLQYHMARVAHWAQNQSLKHYPTAFIPQLAHPITAELAILNGLLLLEGDQAANLVQWSSLAGCLLGATLLASLFGTRKIWLWATAAFAISLPVGILEATSTQNDLLVAFWLISILVFVFRTYDYDVSILDLFTIGLILGLGLLTKGTFFPYAVVPILFLVIFIFRRDSWKRVFLQGLLIGFIALTINLGNWTRNIDTFGTPLGSREFVSTFTSGKSGPIPILAGVTRNILQNFAAPEEQINNIITSAVQNGFGKIDPASAGFTLEWGWNHEDLAGNPAHIVLIIASVIVLIFNRKKISHPNIWMYLLAEAITYILLSAIVRYDPYGNRYQLPFFMTWAPIFGFSLSLTERPKFSQTVIILLLLSAFPWVLFNRTRPLIAMRDSSDPYTIPCLAGCTAGSILIEPPEKTMFAVWGNLGDAYVEAMNQVKETGCRNIGIKLDSNDLEYAYWYLLGAPENGMRLESIVTYPELERYLDPNFEPCVIICTTCGEQTQLFGLERIGSFGNGRIKIFSGNDFDISSP